MGHCMAILRKPTTRFDRTKQFDTRLVRPSALANGNLESARTTVSKDRRLSNYTGIDSARINGMLRHGNKLSSKQKQSINHLDSKFFRTKEPLDLYRGINDQKLYHSLKSLKTNDRMTDNGFVSTSLKPEVAYDFTPNYTSELKNNRSIVKIHVPKGKKVLIPDPDSRSTQNGYKEREVILPRGSKMKVVGHSFHPDHFVPGQNLHVVHTILEELKPENFVTPYGKLEQHPFFRDNKFSKKSEGNYEGGKGFDAKSIVHEEKNGVHHVKVFRNLASPELIGEGESGHSPGMALTKALNTAKR